MKGSLAVLGMVGAVLANPMPQVTSAISPSAAAPSGCSTSHSGTFDLTVVNVTSSSKRDLVSRQSTASTLTLTLSNGVLKDSQGRTGYIAANQQFQFDSPPQTGAIYTAGWSVCGNDSLALGGTAIFYQCLSGTFYNLYAKSQGNQCAAVYFETSAASGSSASSSGAATQVSDGQPQATTAKVSQITDGQPQATTATSAKVSQISDGQPQATTATSAKVSQISDGQPQASTAAATKASSSSAKVSQISDGQPQATTAAASSAKVSQISDGQPQASTAAATSAKVSTSSAKVSQISDGQPQATTATAAVATFTGAAQQNVVGRYAFAAGIVGAVALL